MNATERNEDERTHLQLGIIGAQALGLIEAMLKLNMIESSSIKEQAQILVSAWNEAIEKFDSENKTLQ